MPKKNLRRLFLASWGKNKHFLSIAIFGKSWVLEIFRFENSISQVSEAEYISKTIKFYKNLQEARNAYFYARMVGKFVSNFFVNIYHCSFIKFLLKNGLVQDLDCGWKIPLKCPRNISNEIRGWFSLELKVDLGPPCAICHVTS